jgi:hypothetical protein
MLNLITKETLIISYLLQELPYFMKPENSVPCLPISCDRCVSCQFLCNVFFAHRFLILSSPISLCLSVETYFSFPVMSTALLARAILLEIITLTALWFYIMTPYEFPLHAVFYTSELLLLSIYHYHLIGSPLSHTYKALGMSVWETFRQISWQIIVLWHKTRKPIYS